MAHLIALIAVCIILVIAWLIAEWRADVAYRKRWQPPVERRNRDRMPPL